MRTDYAWPCINALCNNYVQPGEKCPDPAVVRYAPLRGCTCGPGYAQIVPDECIEYDSCECGGIANTSNTDVYQTTPEVMRRLIG